MAQATHRRAIDRGDTHLFVVMRTRGPAWREGEPLEGQADWVGHAAFVNALVDDGFVALGGPLEGTPDVVLVVRALHADDIRSRLAGDPWERTGLLRTTLVAPWTVRLGSLPQRAG